MKELLGWQSSGKGNSTLRFSVGRRKRKGQGLPRGSASLAVHKMARKETVWEEKAT